MEYLYKCIYEDIKQNLKIDDFFVLINKINKLKQKLKQYEEKNQQLYNRLNDYEDENKRLKEVIKILTLQNQQINFNQQIKLMYKVK